MCQTLNQEILFILFRGLSDFHIWPMPLKSCNLKTYREQKTLTTNLQRCLKLQQDWLTEEDLPGLDAKATDLCLSHLDYLSRTTSPHCGSKTKLSVKPTTSIMCLLSGSSRGSIRNMKRRLQRKHNLLKEKIHFKQNHKKLSYQQMNCGCNDSAAHK